MKENKKKQKTGKTSKRFIHIYGKHVLYDALVHHPEIIKEVLLTENLIKSDLGAIAKEKKITTIEIL